MSTLRLTLLITVIVPLNYELCFCRCAHNEYEIDGKCCPSCSPGNHVFWHCADDTSTTCAPCPEHTYTDEPNGFSTCLTCTVCYSSRGLRVSKACTRSADTVCEPLEGFFCTDLDKHSCRRAVQHTECRPGQYIKQAGTGSTDTVCADCEADTYSNGSFSSCKPHTECEVLGLAEINPGTESSDSECGKLPKAIVISVIVAVIIITVVSVFTIKHILKKKPSHQPGIQETGISVNGKASMAVDDQRNAEQSECEQALKRLRRATVSRILRFVSHNRTGAMRNPTPPPDCYC